MQRFLDLGDLDRATIERLLGDAKELEATPIRTTLAGKVLALIFLNPSVRTLASFQAGMAQLGGSSFVITPGQGSWAFETRTGVTMDGVAAEHVREGIPVLAGYADAVGVRCFARGVDLLEDLAEPTLRALVDVCPKPFLNLESAVSHPCQALADWKSLDDFGVPRSGGKFVLSWAGHPKALPLAVPASTLQMAAQRGMQVTVLRPEEFALPEPIMARAKALAKISGGSVQETANRSEAMDGAHVLYAKSWQAPSLYGQTEAEALVRARYADWCVDERWFEPAATDAIFMHCLPVRRNVVVKDEILDGPRSRVLRQANNRLHAQKALLLWMLS